MDEQPDLIKQMKQLNNNLKKQYGKRGICTIGVTPSIKNPSAFVLLLPQLAENKQKRISLMKRGHNTGYSLAGLHSAHSLAYTICTKLRDGSFTQEWMEKYLNNITEQEEKTTEKWIEEYIEAWWKKPIKKDGKQTKKSKKDERQINAADFLLKTFSLLPQDKPLGKKEIEEALKNIPDNQIGRDKVDALNQLLLFADFHECKTLIATKREQAIAGVKPRSKYVPTDDEIIKTYNEGYCLKRRNGTKKGGKHLEGVLRQRWLFGLLATYGIRIHEAWMGMNWTNSVAIKAGEFVEVDVEDENEEYAIATSQKFQGKIIPAFFAPDNPQPLLVIKGGKTGKRIAMPLSPKGQNWVSLFGLKEPGRIYLPRIKDPLKLFKTKRGSQLRCSRGVCDFFRTCIRWDLLDFRFTAHKLRHAYTHRGRLIGVNHQVLALSQGHLPTTADMVYARHFAEERTLEAIQAAQEQIANTQNMTLPPLEAAIAHARLLALDESSSKALAAFVSFIYGTEVCL